MQHRWPVRASAPSTFAPKPAASKGSNSANQSPPKLHSWPGDTSFDDLDEEEFDDGVPESDL